MDGSPAGRRGLVYSSRGRALGRRFIQLPRWSGYGLGRAQVEPAMFSTRSQRASRRRSALGVGRRNGARAAAWGGRRPHGDPGNNSGFDRIALPSSDQRALADSDRDMASGGSGEPVGAPVLRAAADRTGGTSNCCSAPDASIGGGAIGSGRYLTVIQAWLFWRYTVHGVARKPGRRRRGDFAVAADRPMVVKGNLTWKD